MWIGSMQDRLRLLSEGTKVGPTQLWEGASDVAPVYFMLRSTGYGRLRLQRTQPSQQCYCTEKSRQNGPGKCPRNNPHLRTLPVVPTCPPHPERFVTMSSSSIKYRN
eukprot:Hpha_TRINITY_DN26569_c0_g1::TRINITY_DN26569_c0_g1_i1::g.112996::m.112996